MQNLEKTCLGNCLLKRVGPVNRKPGYFVECVGHINTQDIFLSSGESQGQDRPSVPRPPCPAGAAWKSLWSVWFVEDVCRLRNLQQTFPPTLLYGDGI